MKSASYLFPRLTYQTHLIHCMLFNQFPFREMSGEASEIEFDDPMPSDPACRLIRGLLNRDPRQRLRSFRAMQNHAFFHHFDFETLRLKEVFSIVVKVPYILE